MKFYNVPGVSITFIDQGQISECVSEGLLEKGCEKKVKDDTLFNACSISKFLTGVLVLKLTQLGILDLDEDINKKLISWHLPENKFTKLKAVTLRNLLSHQSGIKDPTNSFTELNSNCSAPSMIKILEGESQYNPYPIHAIYEPESEFHYSDAGYCIIQQIIEDVQ
ncbi:MAG: serine hydrolase domain-containing protein, partial [Psychrobacillus sp.]